MHIINPHLTPKEMAILEGTILGGSSIIKYKNSFYLSMRNKNIKWMVFKADFLSKLGSNKSLYEDTTCRWRSMCYPIFKDLYRKFYENGKRNVTEEALDELKDISWMTWFLDCGIYKKETIILNTKIWGDSNKNINKYFLEIGLDNKITNNKIVFTKESSKKFIKIIEPQLPSFEI